MIRTQTSLLNTTHRLLLLSPPSSSRYLQQHILHLSPSSPTTATTTTTKCIHFSTMKSLHLQDKTTRSTSSTTTSKKKKSNDPKTKKQVVVSKQLQLQQQALKEEAKAEAEKLREMQQIEQEYIQLEAKLAQEAQRKQEEEAQFNAMVQDMIAQAEQDMVDVHAMLNVPPPKRQDFDTFWKFVLAWKQHLIYEVKWRAKDIYYEYSITMPYPPGYTPPTPLRKLSLEQHLGLLRDSVRLTFEDIRYQLGRGPPPILLRGVEAHREWMENDRLRRQELEEEEEEEETSDASGVVTTTQTVKKKKRKKSLNRTIVQTFKESSSGNEFVSNLIQSRLMLVRNVMNQFIVGYNEGMGREIDRDALLRRKQAYAEPIRMNKEAVIEKVGTVASTLRKFTDDVKGMTEVSEADLDLANVGNTTIDQQQQAETPSTNKNKATSGRSSTRKSTTSSK